MEHLTIHIRPSSYNFMYVYNKWNIIFLCEKKVGYHILLLSQKCVYIALLRLQCAHHAMQRVLLDTIKWKYIMGTFLASLNLTQLNVMFNTTQNRTNIKGTLISSFISTAYTMIRKLLSSFRLLYIEWLVCTYIIITHDREMLTAAMNYKRYGTSLQHQYIAFNTG